MAFHCLCTFIFQFDGRSFEMEEGEAQHCPRCGRLCIRHSNGTESCFNAGQPHPLEGIHDY